MKFKIVPVSKDYAAKIRSSMKDSFGNEIVATVAAGYGPCRVSLKPFIPGTHTRLLLSHSPFAIDNAFNQPGPIFIRGDEVDEYADIHRFPPEIKADKVSFPLSLIGYSSDQRMIYTRLVGDADVDELIEKIFDEQTDVEYLHARNAEACCYICKIVRFDQYLTKDIVRTKNTK